MITFEIKKPKWKLSFKLGTKINFSPNLIQKNNSEYYTNFLCVKRSRRLTKISLCRSVVTHSVQSITWLRKHFTTAWNLSHLDSSLTLNCERPGNNVLLLLKLRLLYIIFNIMTFLISFIFYPFLFFLLLLQLSTNNDFYKWDN